MRPTLLKVIAVVALTSAASPAWATVSTRPPISIAPQRPVAKPPGIVRRATGAVIRKTFNAAKYLFGPQRREVVAYTPDRFVVVAPPKGGCGTNDRDDSSSAGASELESSSTQHRLLSRRDSG